MSTGGVENPYAGQGPVLLDIGDDVGALVVTVPAELDGLEVEIRRVGHDVPGRLVRDRRHHHQHVAVVPRPTAAGIVHSLVYPELAAGHYRLHPLPGGAAVLDVEVRGGSVTEADWPTG